MILCASFLLSQLAIKHWVSSLLCFHFICCLPHVQWVCSSRVHDSIIVCSFVCVCTRETEIMDGYYKIAGSNSYARHFTFHLPEHFTYESTNESLFSYICKIKKKQKTKQMGFEKQRLKVAGKGHFY